ncbi:MAG: hypothetical protein JJE47_14950 [Acidimicrobiia bacterium]|nr:hypothetical protein [Acidimicrobiia bacterium]
MRTAPAKALTLLSERHPHIEERPVRSPGVLLDWTGGETSGSSPRSGNCNIVGRLANENYRTIRKR